MSFTVAVLVIAGLGWVWWVDSSHVGCTLHPRCGCK